MKNQTKITIHRDSRLKEAYEFIYALLRGLKKDTDEKFFLELIKNQDYPSWLKVQMIKLMRMRLKRLNEGKGWQEFNLIVPKKYLAISKDRMIVTGINTYNFYLDDNLYVKHLLFDSRKFFIHCGFKSKHKTLFMLKRIK